MFVFFHVGGVANKTPVLKSVELDEAAGVTPRVVRTSKPIQAQGRMRANKVRNLLCRQHGVKKKRCRGDKLNKRPCPTVIKGKGNSRVNQVSAVTSLARNPKGISELSRSKQTILPQHRRLAVGKGKKNDSSTRQIDKLFQSQLKENPDEACKDLELHDVIEDISDEEFVEKGQNPCYKSTKAGNVDKGNGDTGISNASGLPNNCLSEGNTGNVISSDRIEEDPIADFSEEKLPCMIEGTAHDYLLTSPAKNKRDTSRTVKTHLSEQIDGMTKQSGTEQCVLKEQEQCTSDLILEGLMSGNNKKQKSFLEEIKVAQCQDEDRREKRNEDFHASSSVPVPTFLCDDTFPKGGIQGQYGIISLFDGVSSIVRILKQKLQQPPTAIILAELDEKIRGLVCAEFGYRSDEQWGYTTDGTACRYVRDVNTILKDNCYLLRQVVAMYPNLKWFIVGGSPCQDLTFAGPSQGLLGLVGSQSRLFFVLLCVIRSMQVLVGPDLVRFLVENAGSMKPVHFVAFCKLLGLPHILRNQYIWDLAKYTPLISRKRNFFRNFGDVEPVQDIPNFFDRNSGPLIDLKGHIIAFAPLLRTRETLKFGICRSSWTLYQPHALVWDYSFWGGKEAFSSACKLGSGKVPCLCWDRLIPPPFLDDWKKFMFLLQKKGSHANDYDPLIGPLLPMFNCKTYKLPMRLLQESEIMNLSGLGDYWVHTSIQDSEKLPGGIDPRYVWQ